MPVHITPKRSLAYDLKEMVARKELLWFFIWRNFKIRYKQTAIGAGWAILQPLILMVVFTVFFNRLAGIESGNEAVPYPIFAYAGLLFWNYFSQATNQSANSLLTFQGVIKKIYFPRFMAPISTSISALTDFFFALIIFIILMFYYQITPELLGVVMFFPLLLLSIITVMGLGLLLSSINIKYRDVQQVLPFFIQSLLFLTPVIYPVSIVSEQFRWLLFLNPMAGVIESIRAGLLGLSDLPWLYLLISTLSGLVIFALGVYSFRKRETEIADWI